MVFEEEKEDQDDGFHIGRFHIGKGWACCLCIVLYFAIAILSNWYMFSQAVEFYSRRFAEYVEMFNPFMLSNGRIK